MHNNREGFSVIEFLVVSFFITVMSTVLLLNFRGSNTGTAALNRVASGFIADLRNAQTLSTSLTLYEGVAACGYGISRTDTTTYIIYAGGFPPGGGVTCATTPRTYKNGLDEIYITKKLNNNK